MLMSPTTGAWEKAAAQTRAAAPRIRVTLQWTRGE
jgi:hypothetical protein